MKTATQIIAICLWTLITKGILNENSQQIVIKEEIFPLLAKYIQNKSGLIYENGLQATEQSLASHLLYYILTVNISILSVLISGLSGDVSVIFSAVIVPL